MTNPLQPLLVSLEDFHDMEALNRRIGDIFEYLDRDQSVSLSMHELNSGLRRLQYKPPISLDSDDWDVMIVRTGLCNERGEVDKQGFTSMLKDQMRQHILNRLVTSLAVADPIQGSIISMLKLQLSQAKAASGSALCDVKPPQAVLSSSLPSRGGETFSLSCDFVSLPPSSAQQPASPVLHSITGQQPALSRIEGEREQPSNSGAGQSMVESGLLQQVLGELKRLAAEQKRMLRDMGLKRDEEWKTLSERLEAAWASQLRREDESARDRARQIEQLEQRLFAVVQGLFRKQEQTLKHNLARSLSVESTTHVETPGSVMMGGKSNLEREVAATVAANPLAQPHHRQQIRHQRLQRNPSIVRSETREGLPPSPWREVELQQAKEKEAICRQRDALLTCLHEETARADWEKERALGLEQGLEYLVSSQLTSDITGRDSLPSEVFNPAAAASLATSREHLRNPHYQIDSNDSGGGKGDVHVLVPHSNHSPSYGYHTHVAHHHSLSRSGTNVLIDEAPASTKQTLRRSSEAESANSHLTPQKEELSTAARMASAELPGHPRVVPSEPPAPSEHGSPAMPPGISRRQGKWRRDLQIRTHDQPAPSVDPCIISSEPAREQRAVSKEELLGDLRKEVGRSRSGAGVPSKAYPFAAVGALLQGQVCMPKRALQESLSNSLSNSLVILLGKTYH